MSDQFVAEIRIFPFNFPPKGWAQCDGQVMPLSQNTALFSLLGTTYGGDGRSTFALPNLGGNVPMQPGQGPGLSLRDLGEQSGTDAITLLVTELPVHTHTLTADNLDPADLNVPNPQRVLAQSTGVFAFQASNAGVKPMAAQGLPAGGGGTSHSNLQPYLTLNFCIALQGIFPPRS
ncbi:MAG: tail fiber protein [bacterium]